MEENQKKKLNILLLIAFILGVAYMGYSVFYWLTANTSSASASTSDQAGSAIATILVMPHLVVACLGTLFNGLALFMNKRGFALTGAILYTVAIALMPIYFMFTIIQAILSYIAFARMKKG